MSELTANWNLTEKDYKLVVAVLNRRRRTWNQLHNYYDTTPSRLMPRIESVAHKLSDATELANAYDDVEFDELPEDVRNLIMRARRYRAVWETDFGETYTDLVADYMDIYGDE